jgi:sulfur-carrier protein
VKQVRILYFASLREALGKGSESIETQAASLADLRAELVARGEPYASALGANSAVRVALNQVIVEVNAGFAAGAEIAFFPPVTGG